MSKKKKSTKGILIKGSLERIPAEVIEEEAFRKTLRNMMKDWSVIYALYKDDKPYYVGLATKGFWRLWRHFKRDRHAGKWNKFSVYRFKRVKYLKDLEMLILHISKPKGNKTIGKIPKDYELTRNLRREVQEYRRTSQKIEKAIKGN
jgi:hypothetical protein